MATIVGIRFKNSGKLYYFDPMHHWPNIGDWAVVETVRGQELGEVIVGIRQVDDESIASPLKPVIRVATQEDLDHQRDNERKEISAFEICQRKILEHKLDMKLVRVEYTFDNSKALFYFTANGRVDFRDLVKELASIFKTRIELRQIGVRDEAKMIGGLGPCGRPICCGTFLANFQPVTIRMAKEQNLSLNPIKISGVCGRLMCCLQYEQEGYEEARRKMPKVGKEVLVEEGRGVVWAINVLKETVRVKVSQGDTSEIKEYPLSEVRRPNGEHFDQQPGDENNDEQSAWETVQEALPLIEQEGILEEKAALIEKGRKPGEDRREKERTFDKKPQRKGGFGEKREKTTQKEHKGSKEQKEYKSSFGNKEPQSQEPRAVRLDKKQNRPQQAPAVPAKAAKEEMPKKGGEVASPWQQALEEAIKKAQKENRNTP